MDISNSPDNDSQPNTQMDVSDSPDTEPAQQSYLQTMVEQNILAQRATEMRKNKIIWISHGNSDATPVSTRYPCNFNGVSFFAPIGHLLYGEDFLDDYRLLAESIAFAHVDFKLTYRPVSGQIRLYPTIISVNDTDPPNLQYCFGVYLYENGILTKLADWNYLYANGPFTMEQVILASETFLQNNNRPLHDYQLNLWCCRSSGIPTAHHLTRRSNYPIIPTETWLLHGGNNNTNQVKQLQLKAANDKELAVPVSQEQLVYYLSEPNPTTKNTIRKYKPNKNMLINIFVGPRGEPAKTAKYSSRKVGKSNKKPHNTSSTQSKSNAKPQPKTTHRRTLKSRPKPRNVSKSILA